MNTYNDEKVFDVNEDVVARKNNQDVVILMKMDDSSSFFKIDGVAAKVWEMINEKKSYGSIVDEISNEYEVEKSQLKEDMNKLINKLYEIDVLMG